MIVAAGSTAGFPKVVSAIASPFSRPKAVDKTSMAYNGLVVDVSQWGARHPGGMGPIKGHMGEDITDLFDNFHGGWPAPLATIFGLQCGTVAK